MRGCFIGACVEQVLERAMILMTGTTDAVQETMDPTYATIESLAMTYRWPHIGDGEEKVAEFFRRCAAWMAAHGRHSVPPKVLDQLADEVGLLLIRGGDPSTPLPPGFLEAVRAG